jgi:hypothetical protein
MDWARPEFMEFYQVQLGSVTFMLVEAILGKLGAKVTHHSIARYLGDHAGSRDAQTNTIAVDDGSLRERERNDGQTINQNVIWRVYQGRDRHAHRSMARAQDIDAINLDRIDNADCPSDFGIGYQIGIDLLAQFRRKLLGIVQSTMTKFFGENYCSGHNRACERATPSFINPGNPRDSGGAQSFLVTKSASPVHFRD